LFELGEEDSPAFPYLAEVTQAAAELDTKPADILRDILSAGHVDLKSVFPLFARAAGVYGFGDTQVKRLMEQVKE
jgi:hypothetical protein